MSPARTSTEFLPTASSSSTNFIMNAAQGTLPYSVSTGSAYTGFEKLQGAKNYTSWKKNMRTVLLSLQQWGLITGTVEAPTPADSANPTASETRAIRAFEVRSISAFMEISFRIADSAKSVLGNTKDPKAAWELLEKRFGASQPDLQPILMAKLHLAKWDGSSTIYSHRDAMVDLRTELADAGMTISPQFFHECFTNSLPSSLDLFVALYDDPTYDVDLLCDKLAKYEMRRKRRDATARLQLIKWDGSSTIHSHRDAMLDLRTELADAGMTISNQCFYQCFTSSLPSSLDLFIALCDEPTYDVDLLCDKLAEYEMRRKLRAGKAEGTLDGSLTLFGQRAPSSSKGKGKKGWKHITCYKCGEKGHIQSKCPEGQQAY